MMQLTILLSRYQIMWRIFPCCLCVEFILRLEELFDECYIYFMGHIFMSSLSCVSPIQAVMIDDVMTLINVLMYCYI